MHLSEEHIRLIFGLKLKQIRTKKQLSLAEVSQLTGISVSYLNEIEKGKKYPKANKIATIADALGTDYNKMVSLKLTENLAPLANLLNSKIFQELPLHLFGIDLAQLINMISNAPAEVNAFLGTLIELGRKYSLSNEEFYIATLRSYLDMHENYFEDLELLADDFRAKKGIGDTKGSRFIELKEILEKDFHYNIVEFTEAEYPNLVRIRSLMINNVKPTLLLNHKLDDSQRAYVFGKEIAFQLLALKNRPYSSTFFEVTSFDLILNNMKASYFSGALLVGKDSLQKDLNSFLNLEHWDPDLFITLLNKYTSSPEMFMLRLTNLLPKLFGLSNIFFLRFSHQHGTDFYELTKELHISQPHSPHGTELGEHYCRRWISISTLKDIEIKRKSGGYKRPLIGIQRSRYHNSKNEYLVITIARSMITVPNTNKSISIGILIDKDSKNKIRFIDDSNIPTEIVNQTCERCDIEDCSLRVALPTEAVKKRKKAELITGINKVIGELKK